MSASALIVVLLASAGDAEEKVKIAVPEMRLSGADVNLGRMLSEVIATETSRVTGLPVVTPADIIAMIGFEEKKQMFGCDQDLGCMAEIGGALGVNLLVVADLGKFGDSHIINIKLVNTKKVEVVARFYKAVEGEPTQLIEVVREAMPLVLQSITPAKNSGVVAGVIEATEVQGGGTQGSMAQVNAGPPTDLWTTIMESEWTRWGVIGLGGAMLITAGSLQIAAKAEHDKAETTLDVSDATLRSIQSPERLERAETVSQAALGLAIAGGVVAAAGATWLLVPKLFPSVSATPVVTGDAAGIVVGGSF